MIANARALADALRTARERQGLGQVEAANAAGMSQPKLSKIERGLRLPSVPDVTALSELYRIPKTDQKLLLDAAQELWAQQSARIVMARSPAAIQKRIGELEAASKLIFGFQPVMVDGLLQTEAYMRLVFGDDDEAIAARIKRQAILQDTSKRFVLLMTEGALRWQAGSPALMIEQLDAIASASQEPAVRLGIIPWTQPVTVFPRHGFHIYDNAVVVGTETATAHMDAPSDLAAYATLFDRLEPLAVFGEAAREELARIATAYRKLRR